MGRYRSAILGYSLAASLFGNGETMTLRKGRMEKKQDGRYYWTFTPAYGGRIAKYDWRPQRYFYGASPEHHEFLSSLPKDILVVVRREKGRIKFSKYTPPPLSR